MCACDGLAKQYTQPCSQPLYGFTDLSKPRSGLSLREIMVFAFSAVSVVSTQDDTSSSAPDQPSSNASICRRSKRPAPFERDERPRASGAAPRPDPISPD